MTLPDQASVDTQVRAFEAELAAAASPRDAQSVRDRYLGRKNSVVASWMQAIAGGAARRQARDRPPRQRAEAGDRDALDRVPGRVRRRRRGPPAPSTSRCPAARLRLGHRHPLTLVRDRMEEIFTRMGFTVVEGPEVEDEWHCFDALNMPAEHPARDMQDTLYLADADRRRAARRTCARCCARTRRRCRSATCRRTRRRSASSCPAACIAATIST